MGDEGSNAALNMNNRQFTFALAMNMMELKERCFKIELFNVIRLLGGEDRRIFVIDDTPYNIRGIEMMFKKTRL